MAGVQTTQGSPTIDRKSELASLIAQRAFCDETAVWTRTWQTFAIDGDTTGWSEAYRLCTTTTIS